MSFSSLDSQNMHAAIAGFPEQLRNGVKIGRSINLKGKYSNINNIVIAGMGGSAIGGDVVRILVSKSLKIPLFVARNYYLPEWVGKNSLVICSSYSGNTEETLSAYNHAIEKGAVICGITTGGKLGDLLSENAQDKVLIPGGLQPRAALAYSVVPMLFLLSRAGFIDMELSSLLEGVADLIERESVVYRRMDKSNPIYTMAEKIAGSLPVIYGENESTSIVASRWKGQFCENSKMLAYHNELPEMNHNEIVGWENNPEILGKIRVIWLRDRDDHPRVARRQVITREVLEELPEGQESVEVSGNNTFERLFHLIHFGDWLSFWCAIVHGTDPSPVKKIDFLKAELGGK